MSHLLGRHHCFRQNPEELLERLCTVLNLVQVSLKDKPSKFVLFKRDIEFLGHLVSVNGIDPVPDKLKAIRDWPTPHCLRDVHAFFGLVRYYRRFVHNFASIAEPLTRFTKRNTVQMVRRGTSRLLPSETSTFGSQCLLTVALLTIWLYFQGCHSMMTGLPHHSMTPCIRFHYILVVILSLYCLRRASFSWLKHQIENSYSTQLINSYLMTTFRCPSKRSH